MLFIRSQKGVSMIEVLVAVAVLSIGLLGTAALQIQSKRANLGSVQRTLASMLVNDLFERMRANPSMYNDYLTEMDASQNVGASEGSAPTTDCAATACTPADLAAYDVWDWERLLIGVTERSGTADTGGLVLPRACMTGPAGGGAGNYTITINWRGHTEFTNTPSDDLCNVSGSGLYDGNEGADTLRRIVQVSSYFDD